MAEELEQEVVETTEQEPETTEETPVEEQLIESEVDVDPIAELQAERDQLADQLLRVQAEIANMKRIHTREKQDAAKYRSQSLATHLLDVVDNLERALATEVTSEDALSLKKGVEMVHAQLVSAFDKEAITVIDPLNESFDPNYHQAVSVMPATDEQPSDTVVNVLQKGYQLNDRVLRPAMVIVTQ